MAKHTECTSASQYAQWMSEQLAKLDTASIDRYAQAVFQAWRDDRQVFVFGNGGSAYTASHHVTDYVKTAAVDGQRRLRAISLIDNIGLTTALGNDVSYDDIFRYPLESYARPGDLAVGISCSGNSPNVVLACQWAKDHGLTVVAITGFSGGKIGPMADIHIHFPSDNYGVVEDLQMSVAHIVAQSLRQRVLVECGAKC